MTPFFLPAYFGETSGRVGLFEDYLFFRPKTRRKIRSTFFKET
jgi:hypothetical protein